MAKKRNQFSGEVLHFNAVRLRVTGSGSLLLYLNSLDEVKVSQLPSITMAASTNIEPVSLANFTDQRAQIEFKTTEINETFSISRMVIFVRPTATGYPQ